MPEERKDRIVLQPGTVHLPAEFREVAEKANKAGLEGYAVQDVFYGIDVDQARQGVDSIESCVSITYQSAETRLRQELGKLLAIECAYWAELEDERVLAMSIGAMGSVSNVIAALLTGVSAEEYKKQVEARDRVPLPATQPNA